MRLKLNVWHSISLPDRARGNVGILNGVSVGVSLVLLPFGVVRLGSEFVVRRAGDESGLIDGGTALWVGTA